MVFQKLLDPNSLWHRVVILSFICILGFGNYFCYDSPSALEPPIESSMGVETSQFTSLYALYSWPNVVMCFFGGLLIDKALGIRLGAIVFLALLLAGQLLFSFGAFSGQFWMMQTGRFVYGLGGESLSVAQNTYVVTWFKGQELNTVFGFQITVSRLGSTLALNTMRPIYDALTQHHSPRAALGFTLLIAASTCAISFVISIILALLDKRAERILNRPVIQAEDRITIKDAVKFRTEFWLLTLICVTFYLTIFPFITLGSKFFQNKWGYEPTEANTIDSVVYIISVVSSPLIGFIVDKVGKNLIFLLASSLLVTIAHMLLSVTYINLWIPMIMFGLGYSIMCSALWPLVAFVVPNNQLATAYGVMQAIQNLGLALAGNISGVLVDSYGYICLELFFVFWVSTSVIFCIILMIQDKAHRGCLNLSSTERKSLDEAADARSDVRS